MFSPATATFIAFVAHLHPFWYVPNLDFVTDPV